MRISVIVPALNEGGSLARQVRRLVQRGEVHEVVVVDASRSSEVAALYADERGSLYDLPGERCRLLGTPFAGRARQMNLGAEISTGDVLMFVHADCQLPNADLAVLVAPALAGPGWGRFDVRLDVRAWWAEMIAISMNLRSACTGVATGDQAIFVSRRVFVEYGGFDDIPLMEDVAFCRRLARHRRPYRVRERVTASARRWQLHGVARTIILMWRLRLLFWLGVDPRRLARYYHDAR